MSESITSNLNPAPPTSAAQLDRLSLALSKQLHRKDIKQMLDVSQLKARRLYADWRIGATDLEKRAYRTENTIFLTFDDYGKPGHIAKILDILDAQNVQAGFFLQGDWAKTHRHVLTDIRSAGHLIGNHTYSHADLLKLSDEQVREEIQGGVASSWLRPPRGRYDDRVRKIAKALGYEICYWSIDSDDWQGVSVEYMSRKILRELHPGAVILMHLHAANTLKLLPELIADIRAKGYEFSSLSDRQAR